jgi:hypothetical protein
MVNASEILKSPDYINANAATKLAIFEKHVASDENYTNANPQTQRAIRAKFGVESGEGMPKERTTMQEIMQAPAGIYRGFKDVTDTLIKGGASAVDYLGNIVGNALHDRAGLPRDTPLNLRGSVDEAAARSAREYEQTYGKSILANTGRLTGNIVATAPVGAVVAAPLKAVGVAAPIVESVASSGFRTGIAPTTGAARAIDLGVRAGGGAVTGGLSAGLVNPDDTTMGAALGAAIPTVAAPVLKKLASSLGFAKDVITGRAAEVRAAEVVRQSLGDQVGPATIALSKARPGITAVQALQEAGISADPFMALGKLAEKMDTKTAYRLLMEAQEATQANQLAAMAGGGTQTAAREAQNVSRNALTDLTTPMRETELGAANTARNVTQRLEPTLNLRQGSMVGALQGQGRAATDAAQYGVRAEAGAPGFLTQGTRAAESDVLADTMGVIKAQRGNEAAFIQKQIDSLADYGLKPINTDNIVASITAKLNDPKIGPSDVNQAVLSKVANKIQEWTAKGGGVIDADALYSIRKNAVGEEIARLYPNADAKQQARFAAKLLTEIKPAIDDAIVDAGGTGWRRYLQTYETGMKEIDQQKLAALALEKFKGSKEEFIKLVRGNNPDAVEDIFGPGSFNIFKEMGRKSGQLEDIASQLERDIKVSEQAAAGAGGLARIMGITDKQIQRIPAFFSVTTTTVNKALDVLEGKITDQVKQILVDGMKSGKSVAELVQKLPSKDRGVVLRTLMKSEKWNPEGVTAPVQLFVDRKNNLAPEQENRNSLRP